MKKLQPTETFDFSTGTTVEDELSKLRNIQAGLSLIDNPYVGNKRKLVVDIARALNENGVNFESVVDLFSGSGVVSLFFKMIGKKVYSNDLLTFSFFNALVFVQNNTQLLTKADIGFLCNNKNSNTNNFVEAHYQERFTSEEAAFLDNYRANVETLVEVRAVDRSALATKAAAILTIEHYILNRCFIGGRLNKGQVLAELEHRIDHSRNKGNSMGFLLEELPIFASEGVCGAYNMDAEDFLVSTTLPPVDLIYIDPPYGSSQSDYATMFAFCEEYIYSKRMDALPHIQNSKKFVQKKDYEEHFRNVLCKCEKFPTWAISFNDDSFTDCDGIKKILLDFRKNVTVVNIDYQYNHRKDNAAGVRIFANIEGLKKILTKWPEFRCQKLGSQRIPPV